MTAPTVPTAPLLQDAIERMDSFGALKGSPTWKTIKQALLAMQRERDEARSVAKGVADVQAEVLRENARLREQLAASERTCGELRASVERSVAGMNALSMQSVQFVDENAKLRARAEASERTVEGLRAALIRMCDIADLMPDDVAELLHPKTELARLEGEGGK